MTAICWGGYLLLPPPPPKSKTGSSHNAELEHVDFFSSIATTHHTVDSQNKGIMICLSTVHNWTTQLNW